MRLQQADNGAAVWGLLSFAQVLLPELWEAAFQGSRGQVLRRRVPVNGGSVWAGMPCMWPPGREPEGLGWAGLWGLVFMATKWLPWHRKPGRLGLGHIIRGPHFQESFSCPLASLAGGSWIVEEAPLRALAVEVSRTEPEL